MNLSPVDPTQPVSEESTSPTSTDRGPASRDPRRGILVLLGMASILAFACIPVFDRLQKLIDNEYILTVIQLALMSQLFLVIGFSCAIPLLWFDRVAAKSFVALAIPFFLWCLFLLGWQWQTGFDELGDWWRQGTSVFLLSLIGGFVPIGLLIWLRRWQLSIAGRQTRTHPVGIADFLVLTMVGAAILAFESTWGMLMEEKEEMLPLVLLAFAFYGLVGAAVTAASLLAMNIFLTPRSQKLSMSTLFGVLLTFILTFTVWGIFVALDGMPGNNQTLLFNWLLLCTTSWLAVALGAFAICWWLRRYHFVLITANDE